MTRKQAERLVERMNRAIRNGLRQGHKYYYLGNDEIRIAVLMRYRPRKAKP